MIFNLFSEIDFYILINMKRKKIFTEQPEKIFNNIKTSRQSISMDIPKKNGNKLKNRKDNSLDKLTKKFIKIVLEEKSNVINLKEITKRLKSKKRRIYDITNVFQGKKILIDIYLFCISH
jgi:hypothetical protein